jgi:glyoxylase-like metal-dependent hydrolase (beta-lactamase superfamily II)
MGHAAFPGRPVWVSRTLADAVDAKTPRAARLLQDARDFDSRWYVARPGGHRWPDSLRGLGDGDRIELGGEPLSVMHLPGHSPDDLGLLVDGLLLVGDYLSPCEIPFVEDADAYRTTLARLLEVLADVRAVVPGHGPRLARSEAVAIARADLEYVDRLLAARDRSDAAAAGAIELPRAADVTGMRDHHGENCAKLGLVLSGAATRWS